MPDVPPGCPPDAGNENGIGKPCTATGSECTGSLKCLCQNWYGYQMPTGMPCFCTIVTYGNNNCTGCGSNAPCCSYNIPINGETISVSACFPSACLYGNQCPALTQ